MTAARKRVLVTGALGFTGRYMTRELRDHGYEVLGLGSGAANHPGYHQIDLMDSEGTSSLLRVLEPDAVIHLAALAFVGHGNVDDFYHVNVLGTRHLLEAIAKSPKRPDCILLASSANVYGNASEGVLNEETPPAPANDYAVSKLSMEYMARVWSDRLNIAITRPFNYTGVGQSATYLLPKIVEHFRRRAPYIELGNLDVWRDFNDVRTVVSLYRRLIETPLAVGQTYNISSGRAYSLREVVALCEELTGHRMEVRVNREFVRDNEVRMLRGDSSKIQNLLSSWKPVDLASTLKWMLDHHAGDAATLRQV